MPKDRTVSGRPFGVPKERDEAVEVETIRELKCDRLAEVELPKLETLTLTESSSFLLISLYEMKTIIPTCLTR